MAEEDVGYSIFWDIHPLYSKDNYNRNPFDFYEGRFLTINILAIPKKNKEQIKVIKEEVGMTEIPRVLEDGRKPYLLNEYWFHVGGGQQTFRQEGNFDSCD